MAGVEIKGLADVIAGLTVGQAAGLAAYLKESYGIEAPAVTAVVSTKAPETKPDPNDVPATVDVVLVAAGEKKIQVIRVVRVHTGLGLKETKDLVDGAPRVVLAGVERELAERVRKELEEQGARVELR